MSSTPFSTTACFGGQLAGDKYAVVGQQVFNISVEPPKPIGSLSEDVNIVDANDRFLVGTTYQNGIRVFETDGSSSVKETETLLDRVVFRAVFA